MVLRCVSLFVSMAGLFAMTTAKASLSHGENMAQTTTKSDQESTTSGLSAPATGVIPGATVRRDLKTGQIRRVEGSVTIPGAKTAKASADHFLRSALNFRLDEDSTIALHLERETESLSGTHLLYQSYYKSANARKALPIFGSVVSVLVADANEVKLVSDNTKEISNSGHVSTLRLLGERRAKNAARRELVRKGYQGIRALDARLGIFVLGGLAIPAWRLSGTTMSPPAAMEIVLNAKTGEVLSVGNVAQY